MEFFLIEKKGIFFQSTAIKGMKIVLSRGESREVPKIWSPFFVVILK